jgi:site-specific recombinase XerC
LKPESDKAGSEIRDKWVQKFLAHLATDRGASVYTQRNYSAGVDGIFALAS